MTERKNILSIIDMTDSKINFSAQKNSPQNEDCSKIVLNSMNSHLLFVQGI